MLNRAMVNGTGLKFLPAAKFAIFRIFAYEL